MFAPRRGLTTFVIGLPIFFCVRSFLELVLGRETDLVFTGIWSVAMAATFGTIALFSRETAR